VRTLIILLLLAAFIFGCGQVPQDAAPTATWIASGQSNMAMKLDGTLADPGEMPALPGFISSISRQLGKPIDMIPTAIGGTSLDCWQVGGSCFESNIRPLQGRIDAVAWWQGEYDAQDCNGLPATYGDRLKTLIQDWREFFANSELAFYVVQLGTVPNVSAINPVVMCGGDFSVWENHWEQIKAGQAAAVSLGNVFLIETEDITFGDDMHPIYAYREIARRITRF
jgi:hypothetical protein